MLEKIKKLLDSGCYVEVELLDAIGTEETHILTSYKEKEEYTGNPAVFGTECFLHFEETKNKILLIYYEDRDTEDYVKILSIKPIARPLYQYKEGDKVVVLDNYEGDKFEVGEVYEVLGGMGGNVNLSTDGTIDKTFPMDVRCIAPVLD